MCIYIYIIVSSFIMFNLVSKLSQASSVLKKAHKKRRKQHKTLVNPSATSRHNSPMTEGGIAMGTLSSTKSEPHRRYFWGSGRNGADSAGKSWIMIQVQHPQVAIKRCLMDFGTTAIDLITCSHPTSMCWSRDEHDPFKKQTTTPISQVLLPLAMCCKEHFNPQGQLRSHLRCSCGHNSSTFEPCRSLASRTSRVEADNNERFQTKCCEIIPPTATSTLDSRSLKITQTFGILESHGIAAFWEFHAKATKAMLPWESLPIVFAPDAQLRLLECANTFESYGPVWA